MKVYKYLENKYKNKEQKQMHDDDEKRYQHMHEHCCLILGMTFNVQPHS